MVASVLRSILPNIPAGVQRFPIAAALAVALAVALILIGNPFARIDGQARTVYIAQPEAIGFLAGVAALFLSVAIQRFDPTWRVAQIAGLGLITLVALLAMRGTLGIWLDPTWPMAGAALLAIGVAGWDRTSADANSRVLTSAAALVAAVYLTYSAAQGLALLAAGRGPPPSIMAARPVVYAAMLLVVAALWLGWLARIDESRDTPLATSVIETAMRWGVLPCVAVALLFLLNREAWPTLQSAYGARSAGMTDVDFTLGRTGKASGDQLIYLSRALVLAVQALVLHLLMRPFYDQLGRLATPFRLLVLAMSLPLFAFLAIALYRRAGNHGWPTSVWQAMLIGGPVLLIGAIAHVRPTLIDLRHLACGIGLVMMLASAGPWSPIGITVRDARDRIVRTATTSGAFENGRIKYRRLDLPRQCDGGDSLGPRRMLCVHVFRESLDTLESFNSLDVLRPLFAGQPWDPFADPEWTALDARAKRARLSRHLGTCHIAGSPPSGQQISLPTCE